jgi:hypothetical protein
MVELRGPSVGLPGQMVELRGPSVGLPGQMVELRGPSVGLRKSVVESQARRRTFEVKWSSCEARRWAFQVKWLSCEARRWAFESLWLSRKPRRRTFEVKWSSCEARRWAPPRKGALRVNDPAWGPRSAAHGSSMTMAAATSPPGPRQALQVTWHGPCREMAGPSQASQMASPRSYSGRASARAPRRHCGFAAGAALREACLLRVAWSKKCHAAPFSAAAPATTRRSCRYLSVPARLRKRRDSTWRDGDDR